MEGGEETARFTAHLFSCPVCRREYEEESQLLSSLEVLRSELPEAKRVRVMSVARTLRSRSHTRSLVPALAAACLLLVITWWWNAPGPPPLSSPNLVLSWNGEIDDRLAQLDNEITLLVNSAVRYPTDSFADLPRLEAPSPPLK